MDFLPNFISDAVLKASRRVFLEMKSVSTAQIAVKTLQRKNVIRNP